MPGTYPTNILVGGDINGNVPTNIRGGNVVEYEPLIASVTRSSADADNRLDAFSGQSRSTNMVPFHM